MLIQVGKSKPTTLTNNMVIGQGGESIIYKDPESPDQWALKIYREEDAKRAKKLDAMLRANIAWPQRARVPLALVNDAAGKIVGYRMRRLTNRYRKLGLVFGEKFSRDHGFTTKIKAQLLAGMQKDVVHFHAHGIVIGDLNDGNEMADEVGHDFVWIDMDSVQFGPYPCMVGTQLYLSPDLYGVDLSKKPSFRPEHDWFSFSVLLTRALTNGVHPFKSGLHNKFASIFDRAEHGATVFDTDVTYPTVGLPPEILSDELVDVLQGMLKRKTRSAFPLEAIEQYRDSLIECKSCGVNYPAMRRKCPSCAQTTVLDAKAAARVSGFTVATLLETKGRILYLARTENAIFAVVQEGSDLYLCSKDDAMPVVKTPLSFNIPPGAWFGEFGGSFVVCPDPSADQAQLYVLDVTPGGIELRRLLTTEIFAGGRAVFATSDRFLYRIAGREILCGERFGSNDVLERPVMQAYEGQTWFTAARNIGAHIELIAGFHREFGDARWFVVRGTGDGRNFTRFDNLAVPQLDSREAMTDFAVYFSAESVMFVRATRKRGVDRVRVDVVATENGALVQSFILEGSDIGPWERVRGKAFFNGLVMHPTDQGVVRERLADRSRQSLIFTSNHVLSPDDLDRLGGGIMVVKGNRVLHLKP